MSEPSNPSKAKTETIRGSVKEAIGKLIGDGKIEAEGRSQRSAPDADPKPKPASKP